MAERTIKATVTTYVRDGVPRFGLRGETVQVDDDTLEAFDKGEEQAVAPVSGPALPPERVEATGEASVPKKRTARKSTK